MPVKCPFTPPYELLREKQMEHQGTSYTVFFAWQCAEMALEG